MVLRLSDEAKPLKYSGSFCPVQFLEFCPAEVVQPSS
jgi:hypothetical protein